MIKVYLYIKTHNKTGLKYFGKTIKDPFIYKGSGAYWKNHIKKHGYDVTTEVIAEFYDDTKELVDFAINFSLTHNIVHSKEWANMILENGLDGTKPKYSKDIVRIIAKEIKTLNDFKNLYGGVYNAAKDMDIFDEVTKHMISKIHKPYTKEEILKIALKYNTIKDFKENDGSAYVVGRKLGILDEMTQHMERYYHKPYTEQEILDCMKNCKDLNDFRNNYRPIYMSAQKFDFDLMLKKCGFKFSRKRITCPHCNKIGGAGNMKRYHFDNCKYYKP